LEGDRETLSLTVYEIFMLGYWANGLNNHTNNSNETGIAKSGGLEDGSTTVVDSED
jgi:hypothetical protein